MLIIDGFVFNDYCQRCQKVMEHKIASDDNLLLGVCSSCGDKRSLTEVNQVYYQNTGLWVTRFKIGNLENDVTGRLLDAIMERRNVTS